MFRKEMKEMEKSDKVLSTQFSDEKSVTPQQSQEDEVHMFNVNSWVDWLINWMIMIDCKSIRIQNVEEGNLSTMLLI